LTAVQQLATYNGMQSTLIDPRIPMEFIEHARAFRMKSEATDNELNAATDHRQAGAKARKPKPMSWLVCRSHAFGSLAAASASAMAANAGNCTSTAAQ
jgi:hypothetical protein